MSALIPVIRQIRHAVLDGMDHARHKLHRLTENLDQHLDDIGRQVRDLDKPDATLHTIGKNAKITRWDANGRPISERGQILEDFGSGKRGDNATDIGHLGNKGDHGGHLGAHRFFRDTADEGIVPQAGNLNTGAWRTMENEWADWVGKGYQVDYTIDVVPPGAVRPDSFQVEYTITDPDTGKVAYRNWADFDNAPGQTFDRVKTRDMPDR
ncbi:DNA/RNA non-specific endonuclease [Microbacterium sp.]|uniref:DNA/RNA non-specific endonuclease n=1 Tax=Microbacterium sp. TaxID=51671 RepID=UPI0039E71901